MKQTYSCKIVGLSAETLGDLLDAINKVNRGRFGDAAERIGEPVVTAHKKKRTTFDVLLLPPTDPSIAPKIQTIRVVRELTGLGLKEAKDLVESAPKKVVKDKTRAEAEEIMRRLHEVGADAKVV